MINSQIDTITFDINHKFFFVKPDSTFLNDLSVPVSEFIDWLIDQEYLEEGHMNDDNGFLVRPNTRYYESDSEVKRIVRGGGYATPVKHACLVMPYAEFLRLITDEEMNGRKFHLELDHPLTDLMFEFLSDGDFEFEEAEEDDDQTQIDLAIADLRSR